MGVKGLTSYIRRSPNSFADHLDLSSLAVSSNDRKVRLAVDGFAFCYYLLEATSRSWEGGDPLCLRFGGDYPSIALAVRQYIAKLRAASIEPLFVFDGMQDPEKVQTSIQRREKDILKGNAAYHMVKNEDETALTDILLPIFITEIFTEVFQEEGVFWTRSEREADADLVSLCTSQGCVAVLSNDSDFLIFDVPGLIPFWAFEFTEAGTAHAFVFSRQRLASVLGLDPNHLPVLSCLLGNDYLNPDSWNLHTTLLSRLPKRSKSKNASSMAMVVPAANFLAKFYDGNDMELCVQLFPFLEKKAGPQSKATRCTNRGLEFKQALDLAKSHYQVHYVGSELNSELGKAIPIEADQVYKDKSFWYKVIIENQKDPPVFGLLERVRLGWYTLLFKEEIIASGDAASIQIMEYRRRRGRIKRKVVSCSEVDVEEIIQSTSGLDACCKIFGIEEKTTLIGELDENFISIGCVLLICLEILLKEASDEGLGANDEIGLATFALVATCPSDAERSKMIEDLEQENRQCAFEPQSDWFLEEWMKLQVVVMHVNLVLHSAQLKHLCLSPSVLSCRLAKSIFTFISNSSQEDYCHCPELLLERRKKPLVPSMQPEIETAARTRNDKIKYWQQSVSSLMQVIC